MEGKLRLCSDIHDTCESQSHDVAWSDASGQDDEAHDRHPTPKGTSCKLILEDAKDSFVEGKEGPDGGWGWIVLLASFVIQTIAGAASANFGVLFSEFLIDLNTSSALTAWIFNLGLVLSSFSCYLLDPLVEEFGWRVVSISMGIMMSLGTALSAFATSAYYLLFSYSILASIPVEVLMIVSHAIVPQYFTRRMTLACSLTSVGGSVSLLIFPILLSTLLDNYGFRGAALIMAAITLNCCTASMVFHPIEWHVGASQITKSITQKQVESGNTFHRVFHSIRRVMGTAKDNLWLFRSVQAVITNSLLTTNTMAFANLFYLIPFAMEDEGYSAEEAALALSVAGFALVATRFIYPPFFIYFKLCHQTGVMASSVIIATSIIVFSWVPGLWPKMTSMTALGIGVGMFFTSFTLVVVEVLGLPLLTPMLSISGVFKGISIIIFGPFVGWIRDITDSYPIALSVLGVLLYVTAILWLSIPAARNYDLRRGYTGEYEQLQETKIIKKEKETVENILLLKK